MEKMIGKIQNIIGQKHSDLVEKYGEKAVEEYMLKHELNICDVCGIIQSTYDLDWENPKYPDMSVCREH